MRIYKMNGAGNAFAVADLRRSPSVHLSPDQIRTLAAEFGADQVVALEPSPSLDADLFMRIWNNDGGEVDACGNVTRCVAWLKLREDAGSSARIQTGAGLLVGEAAGDHQIRVDMGRPGLGWEEIPLSRPMNTTRMDYAPLPGLAGPGAVWMGNPHVVFFVDDAETRDVRTQGALIEVDPLFPAKVNVGFAQVLSPDHIRLRVWERAAGLTKACGTGACAAWVAGVRQGRLARAGRVTVDGGELHIEWRVSDDHVLMTGPIELEAETEWPLR